MEIVDAQGRRCPLANDTITFGVEGPMEWRGGVAQGKDNFVLARSLPVEAGINRVMLRSLPEAGDVKITASAPGFATESISLTTIPVEVKDGLTTYNQREELPGRLDRGETPLTPSYYDKKVDVKIESATAGYNQEKAGQAGMTTNCRNGATTANSPQAGSPTSLNDAPPSTTYV